MVPARGRSRRIQNSFRVGCSSRTGASQSVHKGETLGNCATRHSDFAFSNNIDHLLLVIWLASCLQTLHCRHCLFLYHNLSKDIRVQWGCTIDATSTMLEWVSAKGEVTFSGAKLDILQLMAWFLHGGYICLFNYIKYYLISSLINLSASNDISMCFQGDIEERYSNFLHYTILQVSICLPVINFKIYWCLLDFIDSMPYRGNIKGFPASWEVTAASRPSPIIQPI